MDPRPQDVQATYCATLVDEWVRHGVAHAVVAPGSRSTPMALALAADSRIAVHVVHDERAAGFVALGLGLDGAPAVLLCTSGTAAANFYPAVVEAALSEIPILVVTADRPDELRGVGAPQTIDQLELYGNHVRWFRDPGVADGAARGTWRELARDAWTRSATGPVQLNLAFREPLLGTVGPLPPPEPPAEPVRATRRFDEVPGAVDSRRGVILAGGRSGVDERDVAALHASTGWPIVADPISTMRHLDGAVAYADGLLRSAAFVAGHRPDVIVRIGRPAASKVLAQWSASIGAALVQIGGPGVIDPDHNVTAVCSIDQLLSRGSGWRRGSMPTGAPTRRCERRWPDSATRSPSRRSPARWPTTCPTPRSSSWRPRCPCATWSGSVAGAPAPTPTAAPTASTGRCRRRSAGRSPVGRPRSCSVTSRSSTTPTHSSVSWPAVSICGSW